MASMRDVYPVRACSVAASYPGGDGRCSLLHIQRGKVQPRQRVLEVSPDPLNRVQLRTIGRQEPQAHVFRPGEPLGGMGPAVVQQQEIQASRNGLREPIDEALEMVRMQLGQC